MARGSLIGRQFRSRRRLTDRGEASSSADLLDRAHLFLLTNFLLPAEIHKFGCDRWEGVLGEPPIRAIERFTHHGLIEKADAATKLGIFLSVSDLKSLLRQQGLSDRGSKAEMAQRFFDHQPDKAAEAVSGITAYQCSEHGRPLAEAAVERYKEVRGSAERAVSKALKQRDFAAAAKIVVEFEAAQVFPRGINVKWDADQAAALLADVIELYQARPTILHGITEDMLETLRPAAAMMMLWGENRLHQKIETGIHLPGDVVARMLIFSVNAARSLSQMRSTGILNQVGICAIDDSCNECRERALHRYPPTNVPELPHPACTHPMGCRCRYIPYF
jgi:hypothetical protein